MCGIAGIVNLNGQPVAPTLLDRMIERVRHRGPDDCGIHTDKQAGLAHAAAHITGGGWTENVPRSLGPGLGARIDRQAWTPQPIFAVIAQAAGIDPRDLFGVLNMGIGMVVAVARDAADQALDVCRADGIQATVVGEVTKQPGIRFGAS